MTPDTFLIHISFFILYFCFGLAENETLSLYRANPDFESTAGTSSELIEWQVALILISLMIFLTIITILSLHCNDRRNAKIDVKEEATTLDDVKETKQRKFGVVHQEKFLPKDNIKTVSETVEPPSYSSLYLQRNAGYYSKGAKREPLPPLPTSVFLISLPTPTDYNNIHQVQDRYV